MWILAALQLWRCLPELQLVMNPGSIDVGMSWISAKPKYRLVATRPVHIAEAASRLRDILFVYTVPLQFTPALVAASETASLVAVSSVSKFAFCKPEGVT